MKKSLIIFVLMICLAAVAFATIQTARHKASTKTEKQKNVKQKRCSHNCCWFY